MSRKGVANQIPFSGYRYSEIIETLKGGPNEPLFRGGLEVDDSAFQPDGNGVGAIVGIQFRENIFDVTFHGFFRDGELGGYLFVGIPARNQPRNFNFPLGQGIVGGVLGEFRSHLGQQPLLPGVHCTDGFQKFFSQETLEQIGLISRPWCCGSNCGCCRFVLLGCPPISPAGSASPRRLQECPFLQFFERPLELLLRVHHDRTVPSDGLLQWLPRDQEEPDSFLARLYLHFVASVEENQ